MKIGVGILTFDRESYLQQVFDSLSGCQINDLVIVNDGPPFKNFFVQRGNLIQHPKTEGIAKAKNDAIDYLLKKECSRIFLIEDDILVKDKTVFQKYIQVADFTGLHHLNFELAAGNHKKLDFTYEDGETRIALYQNPQGAFSYTHANVFKKLGTFDENYVNAFEHIDFYYRLVQAELLPPFWYAPDIAESQEYLAPILGSSENSTITNKKDYQKNWTQSAQYFIQKFGHFTNQIPDPGCNKAVSRLQQIQKLYGAHNKLTC